MDILKSLRIPYISPYATSLHSSQWCADLSPSSITSINTLPLVYTCYLAQHDLAFELPTSNLQIRLDTREDGPHYTFPARDARFQQIRRLLYDILTSNGWGISDQYPVAVRATVKEWVGNGEDFWSIFEMKDGFQGICPSKGEDDQGVERVFEKEVRWLVGTCVGNEVRRLWEMKVRAEREVEDKRVFVDEYLALLGVNDGGCGSSEEEENGDEDGMSVDYSSSVYSELVEDEMQLDENEEEGYVLEEPESRRLSSVHTSGHSDASHSSSNRTHTRRDSGISLSSGLHAQSEGRNSSHEPLQAVQAAAASPALAIRVPGGKLLTVKPLQHYSTEPVDRKSSLRKMFGKIIKSTRSKKGSVLRSETY